MELFIDGLFSFLGIFLPIVSAILLVDTRKMLLALSIRERPILKIVQHFILLFILLCLTFVNPTLLEISLSLSMCTFFFILMDWREQRKKHIGNIIEKKLAGALITV